MKKSGDEKRFYIRIFTICGCNYIYMLKNSMNCGFAIQFVYVLNFLLSNKFLLRCFFSYSSK